MFEVAKSLCELELRASFANKRGRCDPDPHGKRFAPCVKGGVPAIAVNGTHKCVHFLFIDVNVSLNVTVYKSLTHFQGTNSN